MALSLKPGHLKRYKDIARIFLRYGHSDLLPPEHLDELAIETCPSTTIPTDCRAEQFAADLEEMGPLYIKLGQVLSSRPEILPERYVLALTRGVVDNQHPASRSADRSVKPAAIKYVLFKCSVSQPRDGRAVH